MATRHDRINLMNITVEDYYCGLDQWLRRYKGMNLARWKLVQTTIISILVGYLALEAGSDPTVSVMIIALINGISIAELATLWGVSIELKGEGPLIKREKKKQKNDEQPAKDTERR